MLPKIISNITLALIAIFIIYTIAPLFKEYLLTLFGAPKKKDYDKEEFEEMVKRKTQMLSSTGRLQSSSSESSNISAPRNEFDYLIDNHFFVDDRQKDYFLELKREISWGQGELLDQLKTICTKHGIHAIEDKSYVQHIKNNFSKASLLNLFPQKGITLDLFYQNIATTLLLANLENELMLKKLSQSLMCTVDQLRLIIHTTVNKEQNQDCVSLLEDYILEGKIVISELKPLKNFLISDFIILLKKNLDMIIPLTKLDEDKIKQEINNKKEDPDYIKKKHKRMLSLYHPDKWTFLEKTKIIDQRLRENFDKVQTIFKTL